MAFEPVKGTGNIELIHQFLKIHLIGLSSRSGADACSGWDCRHPVKTVAKTAQIITFFITNSKTIAMLPMYHRPSCRKSSDGLRYPSIWASLFVKAARKISALNNRSELCLI